jgi:hypothetical protein
MCCAIPRIIHRRPRKPPNHLPARAGFPAGKLMAPGFPGVFLWAWLKSDRKIHIRGAGDPTQLGGGGKIEAGSAGSGGSPVPKFAGVADRSVAAGFLIGAGGDIFTGETFALATVSRGGGSAGENVL